MANVLNTAVSGLLSFQRAMGTTSHNIANVNTEGYSRQRVDIQSLRPNFEAGVFIGTGSSVNAVSRVYDQFINDDIRVSTSLSGKLDLLTELARNVEDVVSDSAGGLSTVLHEFFSSVQDVADDPSSLSARNNMINVATTLASVFNNMDDRFEQIEKNANRNVRVVVGEINTLVDDISKVNIAMSKLGGGAGSEPADLLDMRDQLILQLSQRIDISLLNENSGNLSIFIGSGQNILAGTQTTRLATVPDVSDPSKDFIVYEGLGQSSDLTDTLRGGGELGALLQFRDEMLLDARNDLGRIAVALAETFNTQHRSGMDLNGDLGGDFFSVASPGIIDFSGNAGSAIISSSVSDSQQLTRYDATLEFDGSNWRMVSDSGSISASVVDGSPANTALSFEGITLTIDGASSPVAGDRYRIRPTSGGAESFSVVTADPLRITAAGAVRSSASLDNIGTSAISTGVITDATHPNLLNTVNLTFDTPPATFRATSDVTVGATVFAAGAAIPFSNGMTLDANGWQTTLSGIPQAGDLLTVESNSGGSGDNRNMLLLANLQNNGSLDSGSTSFQEAYSTLVGRVGSQTAAADTQREAAESLLLQAKERRDSKSGVNLDEEAADLIRFQQAYEAASRVISTTQAMFDAMIQAMR
jgi:flagellar hook-associated protein 1 FlgK